MVFAIRFGVSKETNFMRESFNNVNLTRKQVRLSCENKVAFHNKMSDDKEIGENCTFIFKKRCLKRRGARPRQQSSSEEGWVFAYFQISVHFLNVYTFQMNRKPAVTRLLRQLLDPRNVKLKPTQMCTTQNG